MSMYIICESNKNLSIKFPDYNFVLFEELDSRFNSIVKCDHAWTSDIFDDLCTDAYEVWNNNKSSSFLEDFLCDIISSCSQIICFYWFNDAYYTVSNIKNVFYDKDKYVEYIKKSILSDGKCMFNCWYKS